MKHIFKKLHIGSNHDPNRSSDSSIPVTSPSCSSDHRAASSSQQSGNSPASPSSAPSSTAPVTVSTTGTTTPSSTTANRSDYMTSEEEFQFQLALAISASNSEFGDDPEKDQIRAATLLSLDNQRVESERDKVEAAAGALSKHYWVSFCEFAILEKYGTTLLLPVINSVE